MATMNFNTANQTFRQLLGNGLQYRVPSFQRDYSWTETEWDDLWQDILGLFEPDGESGHYMGYLVLQSADNKNFDIIDGQQRMTTISIMILAALGNFKELVSRNIESENNQKRRDSLANSYIGYIDPITLTTRPKLELNRHNNKYFSSYIVPLEKLPQRGLNASEHLLRKSYDWFFKKFDVYAGKAEGSGEKLAFFIDTIVDKLFFTVINVTDELNAFTVFETLNSRGVRLSSTDLLKNYLFSLIASKNTHNTEIEALENKWERIVGNLGSDNFSEFLRIFWNSQNRLTRKTELFKVVRKNITDKGQAFQLLRDLDAAASVYVALRDVHDSMWKPKESEAIKLFNTAQVKQQYAILMALYRNFFESQRDVFTKVLHAISVIVFRYNVICNHHANDQEKIYSKISQKISDGTFSDLRSILIALRELYPDDDVFKASFSKKEFITSNTRNRKVVKYILSKIEKNSFGRDFNVESDTYNIEHILPENASEDWNYFDEEKQKRSVYRIGNMTLFDSTGNRKVLGNKSYVEKRVEFEKSEFGITKYIAEHYITWDEDKIDSRQKHLARAATGIWKINFDI